jgi:hypothetical protein
MEARGTYSGGKSEITHLLVSPAEGGATGSLGGALWVLHNLSACRLR